VTRAALAPYAAHRVIALRLRKEAVPQTHGAPNVVGMTQTPHDHAAHDHAHGHGHGPDDERMVELLDLEAAVLSEHIASITAWLPVRTAPRRIVDLGAGTGAGTLALLRRFPEAEATAVDASAAHLRRLVEKAEAEGLAGRVRTAQADLDVEGPEAHTGPEAPELVWASASLHHMADPGRTLRQVHGMLPPGGLFAVVELDGFPRFLPPDAPEDRPGLEDRCHAEIDRQHAEHLPHRGADWAAELKDAGFTVEDERTVTVDIGPPHTETVGRYALTSLSRLREGVAGKLAAEDLAALDRLLDADGPHGLLRRDDLAVRTERTVWAARRE
jgi:SAM-dependent methyltransferase